MKQADALVRGDEAGWVAPVHPAMSGVRRQLADRFALLTAMGVTAMRATMDDLGTGGGPVPLGALRTRIMYAFCAQWDPSAVARHRRL